MSPDRCTWPLPPGALVLRPWRWPHFLSLWSSLGPWTPLPFLHANCWPHRAVESPREPSVRSCGGAVSARPREYRPVQPKRTQFSTAQPSITQPTGAQYSPVQLSPVEPSCWAQGRGGRVRDSRAPTAGLEEDRFPGWAVATVGPGVPAPCCWPVHLKTATRVHFTLRVFYHD